MNFGIQSRVIEGHIAGKARLSGRSGASPAGTAISIRVARVIHACGRNPAVAASVLPRAITAGRILLIPSVGTSCSPDVSSFALRRSAIALPYGRREGCGA